MCCRVVNMGGVDLSRYRFDYDLTFAVLLMHADGTIYRRFGNRDWTDPLSHLSDPALQRALEETLEDHAAYVKDPKPPARGPAVVLEDMPPMRRRIEEGRADECQHCHTINDMRREMAIAAGSWKAADAWTWPPSRRVGLVVDRDDQSRVAEVLEGSPASAAGLKVGDRLQRVGGCRVRTEGDVQSVLEDTPAQGARVPVEWVRGETPGQGVLELAAGWREGDPVELSWRSQMWHLTPQPGFGGREIDAGRKRVLGLDPRQFAYEVNYLVTWGEHAHTGRNAAAAGIRKGDIVLSVGGKSDFESERHSHAWFRLTRKAGEKVPVELLRDGKRLTVELTVVE